MQYVYNLYALDVVSRTATSILSLQMEIAKRLNAIIAQLLPFLSQEVNLKLECNNIVIQRLFFLTIHQYYES